MINFVLKFAISGQGGIRICYFAVCLNEDKRTLNSHAINKHGNLIMFHMASCHICTADIQFTKAIKFH